MASQRHASKCLSTRPPGSLVFTDNEFGIFQIGETSLNVEQRLYIKSLCRVVRLFLDPNRSVDDTKIDRFAYYILCRRDPLFSPSQVKMSRTAVCRVSEKTFSWVDRCEKVKDNISRSESNKHIIHLFGLIWSYLSTRVQHKSRCSRSWSWSRGCFPPPHTHRAKQWKADGAEKRTLFVLSLTCWGVSPRSDWGGSHVARRKSSEQPHAMSHEITIDVSVLFSDSSLSLRRLFFQTTPCFCTSLLPVRFTSLGSSTRSLSTLNRLQLFPHSIECLRNDALQFARWSTR